MRRVLVVLLLVSSFAVVRPPPVYAACAAPPEPPPTFREMIRAGSTFDAFFDRMILGRVAAIRDRGARGGRAIAVLAVAAHPTGRVPLVARVRFYRPPPGVWVEDNLEFHVGERWVVIAHRRADGSFKPDGGCGRSRRVSRAKFHDLVALAKELDGQ